MPQNPTMTDKRLRSLRGQVVVFTGRLSMLRADAVRLAQRKGAAASNKVSGTTTIVVQGAPSGSYTWPNMGLKLAEVYERRRRHQRIYVISEDEFRMLIDGHGLPMAATRAAAEGRSASFGVPWRPPAFRSGSTPPAFVDFAARERATREHQRLTALMALWAENHGVTPMAPVTSDCAYDVAWSHKGRVSVVEVKTINRRNEAQQVRLAIGQVLDYRLRLEEMGTTRVRPVVALSTSPSGPHWRSLCERAGVELTWAPFRGLAR